MRSGIMTKPKTRIRLVSMPFASLASPSLALTQLKSVVEDRLPGEVDVEILYLNHEFATTLGDLNAYRHVLSNRGFMSGIGDWFFRQAAFPDSPDNTDDYVGRYYSGNDDVECSTWKPLLEKRAAVNDFLDSVIRKYALADADIVGMSALFAQTMASFALARRLKAVRPDVMIIMGGAACTGEMGVEFSRQVSCVDYFFSGPGLVSFPEFVSRFRNDDRNGLGAINGVLRHGEGPGLFGEERDIQDPVMLDYDSFLGSVDHHFPGGGVEPILLFETSRGCWWGERQRCTFCGLNGPSLRFREMTPEQAIAHIQTLYRYAARCTFLESVDTVLPRDYLKGVMPGLHTPPGIKIQYEVRATLREPELKTLCDAGVTMLQPGIESLSSETLALMNKGTTSFQNIRFLKACARFPVTVGWNLLLFSPGEPVETLERTLRLIPALTHLHPPQSASLVGFVRYSEYFDRAFDFGLDLMPEDFYGLTFPFEPDALARIAVKFTDTHADVAFMEGWLDRMNAAVDRWKTRWLNADNLQESRLCLARHGDSTVVYDSRNGKAVLHRTDGNLLSLLEFLDTSRTLQEVAAAYPDREGERALDWLRERGMIFEEGRRVMSLVIGDEK
jgi:ribosomal peptide maturation radical SAM protein 1